MSKVEEAQELLRSIGLPPGQQNERSALTLLALANVRPNGSWKHTQQPMLRIWDIMAFMREEYGKDYAPNTRETIRRQTIHQFEQARIVDRNPDNATRPTNSGKTCYALTEGATQVLKAYKTHWFDDRVAGFIKNFGSLQEAYSRHRKSKRVPLKLPGGATVYLSPGKHNELQVACIEELGPRFAPGASVVYVGDTARKHVVRDADQLVKLKIPITEHDKLPDVVLLDKKRKWLFLIEAVTTHGPVSPKRHRELEYVLRNCPAERIYITAFLTISAFRKYAADIAWETEVWVGEHPDHMIHFNGPKFLGPYKPLAHD